MAFYFLAMLIVVGSLGASLTWGDDAAPSARPMGLHAMQLAED